MEGHLQLPRWSMAASLHRTLVLTGSSVFGLGYLPLAPGTWGSLGGLALWYAWSGLDWPLFAGLTALLTLLAIYLSSAAEAYYGGHDVQLIVVDEVAGMLFTVIAVPWQPYTVLTAFLLFRFLDAYKPPPIRWLDRHVGGGFGVVIDDVAAGIIGCGILHGIHIYKGAWW